VKKKGPTLEAAISAFGTDAKNKLAAVAIRGEPEDQLRFPVENLVKDMAQLCRRNPDDIALVGETALTHLKTRPDFAISYRDTLIGFLEIKAPGKGADPRKFRAGHDMEQWKKLSALPNLLYTDGNAFSLWQNGELVGRVIQLDDDIETAGRDLSAPPDILSLFERFFSWQPITPANAQDLADVSARLCRLLREEVAEQLARGDEILSGLARDWRDLLFPEATHKDFADSYAQAVTFGLLLARSQGISLNQGVGAAAKTLSQSSHSLIGAALRVLTDSVEAGDTLSTSVATLSRVLSVVDWPTIAKGDPDAWLYFYEHFLAEYDANRRKQTGSYYTPVEVVSAMTRLVDEVLQDRLGVDSGLADTRVNVVDPAVGTGTFLLEVIRFIAARIAEDQGAGAVPAAITKAMNRLIGFELQLGPFAVAQLRVLAELLELGVAQLPPDKLRMFVTNTLDNPYVEQQRLGTWYEPIAQSRRDADRIKREESVWVVLGNPPYKDKSHGKGGWVEKGNPKALDPAPLDDFIPPKDWGAGAHIKHLYNPYVYFWRWGTWKVFDNHPEADKGVVCFITVSGFLHGPGFQRMRDYLRRRADAVWVIDCSPEGHMPEVNTRVFEGVKQPICIVMAVRDGSSGPQRFAPVYYRRLKKGRRNQKFTELGEITIRDDRWSRAPDEGRASFLPQGSDRWSTSPSLDDLLLWSGSGVMPGRTWVIAPDVQTLYERWNALIHAASQDKPGLLSEHRNDRRIDTVLSTGLDGTEESAPKGAIGDEKGPCPEPVRIGYRSFDRQWIIPDKRLINRPNPALWRSLSDDQLFLTALNRTSPFGGPAATFTSEIPDIDHFNGRAGRVYPLWLDEAASIPNIVPGLSSFLGVKFNCDVLGKDVFAYLAAILAFPAFCDEFADELSTPGIRIPLTSDRTLFREAVEVGEQLIWMQTYGQRYTDPNKGRPRKSPRLPKERAPRVLAGYPIPHTSEAMPEALEYDAEQQVLIVGQGRIENVTRRMRSYGISGVNVLDKWFSYRRKDRERPVMGDRRVSALLGIHSHNWLPEYTSELLDLLHVIGLIVDLEEQQNSLFERIVGGTLISVEELARARILPVTQEARKISKARPASTEGTLFSDI
jgi:hypothetical protein